MNRIRIFGIAGAIIGSLGMFYFERSDLDFLFGIIAGIGVGWALTGKLMELNKKKEKIS